MAITSYFINIDWSYQEVLLRFKPLKVSSPGSRPSTALHNLLHPKKPKAKPVSDEITQYLNSKNHSRFPTIASLARDILTIPATNAGVERLFNTARDICHYRRGRMKAETIKELILFLCISRFDLKLHEAKELKQFFSLNEIEALREEKDDKLDDVEFEQISDTEE
ncbi:HAT dimerisation [Penicillium camemberti]|uniref:HAT dimerisation n=1 Tax=Penicillium camemberti (strain FM 013) TaxID=1429867 RepID=A0A0G4PXD6_PENC3|nr:HAT dimerisation [Penicillium camemberti]